MSTNRAVFAAVVSAVREQTTLLLGTTIGFSDDDWAQPTSLTGWTRSHIAAHLVQGAQAFTRVINASALGYPERLYASEEDKRLAIELGALESGLALQIGLDTSAGELQAALPTVEGDERPVTLRAGLRLPAHELPLARLSEITLHHLDLGGPGPGSLDPSVASELLRFHAEPLAGRDDWAPTRLIADEGVEFAVGPDGDSTELRGSSADLLAWLARGVTGQTLARNGPGSR